MVSIMKNQVISGCGFHHVAIWTANWDKSIQFYCEGLGFTLKLQWQAAPRRAAMLDCGDGNYLELFEREVAPTSSGEPPILHLCFRADNCAAAVEAARSAGAEVTMEAKSPDVFTELGLKTVIAFVKGPSGEIVEFFESKEL